MGIKKLTISCLLIAALLGAAYFKFFPIHKQPDIAKIIKTLPSDDRAALESFFRCLYRDTFSYVLFGDKPMSICLFLETEPYHPQPYQVYDFMDCALGRLSASNFMEVKGWETWKKYQQVFPLSNFTLLENRDGQYITIFMINKNAFLKTIEENIVDFREILGADVTPHRILDSCIQSDNIFRDVLKNNYGLFGILLGYGRHNAFLFSRREEISRISNPEKISLPSKPLFPSPGFSTIEEEYRYLNEKLTRFDENDIIDFNPLLITLPMFVADHEHPETQQLKIKYKQQYKSIIRQYESGDFLEVTLRRYCNPN